ncbi:MAG: ABC transporter ATP-binding protein [Candidatus Acidiferrales bacterium]
MSATSQTMVARKPAPPQVSGWQHLKRLLPYVMRYKGMTALGLLTLVLMGLVGNLAPLVIGVISDLLVGSPVPFRNLSGTLRGWLAPLFSFYQPSSRHALVVYCLVLVGIVAVKGAFSFWTRWILIGVSRDIEYDLRNDLLAKLLELEPEFYVRNRTGELMSRATNDLNAVRMVLGPGIMYSATTLTTLILAIVVMVAISPSLTFWVLLPVPLVAISMRYFGEIIHRLSEVIQAALATLSAKAQENLAGVRVVRAYAQEEAEARSFNEANQDYVTRNVKLIGAWSMFFPLLQALIGLTFLIVLWEGGRLVMQGRISYGAFSSYYSYMVLLIFPMVALGWVTNIFQRGAASMGRLNYILDSQPRIQDESIDQASPPGVVASRKDGDGSDGFRAVAATSKTDLRGEIEFRNLTFTYPTAGNGKPTAPVLEDISLRVPAGTTLAVVGPTGSGKSTLAALMARLWEAPPGTLLLDGRSISEWPLARLRQWIGFVPQDTFLFSETLCENIALGAPSARPEDVAAAAEIASLAGDIEGFPMCYDTMVGERGITLSGGQKQRTALARAVIRDPKILILDDALSSVDTETEERILRRLRDIMRQRTTIVVSHRVSTVRHADQIVVLSGGRIVERGTHDELLALGGYYADLYQKQLLEEELEKA